MLYRVLAESVLVLHFCFVLFAALGGLLVLRRRWLIWLHLPALAWGILVEFLHLACPLTPLENWFRRLGGESGYTGGFIEHYLSAVLYPEITLEFQTMLGILLIGVNLLIYFLVFLKLNKSRKLLV